MSVHIWTVQLQKLQKRMPVILAALASALFALPGAAQRDAVWDAPPWGSSPAELRQRFDGRLRDSAPGEPGDAVADVSVDGCPARARLSFGADGLERIVLVARPSSCGGGLEARLHRRLGRPASERRAPGDVTLEWSLPTMLVTYDRVHFRSPSFDWDRELVTYERRSGPR